MTPPDRWPPPNGEPNAPAEFSANGEAAGRPERNLINPFRHDREPTRAIVATWSKAPAQDAPTARLRQTNKPQLPSCSRRSGPENPGLGTRPRQPGPDAEPRRTGQTPGLTQPGSRAGSPPRKPVPKAGPESLARTPDAEADPEHPGLGGLAWTLGTEASPEHPALAAWPGHRRGSQSRTFAAE